MAPAGAQELARSTVNKRDEDRGDAEIRHPGY